MSNILMNEVSVCLMYVGFGDFIHFSSSSMLMYCGTFMICVRYFGVLLYSPLKYSDILHSSLVNSTVSWLKLIVYVLSC